MIVDKRYETKMLTKEEVKKLSNDLKQYRNFYGRSIIVEQMLNDTYNFDEVAKYYSNQDLYESIPHDYYNIYNQIIELKAKTLKLKSIGFENTADNDRYTMLINALGNDFWHKVNKFVEAYKRIIIVPINDENDIGVDYKILLPHQYYIRIGYVIDEYGNKSGIIDGVYEIVIVDGELKEITALKYDQIMIINTQNNNKSYVPIGESLINAAIGINYIVSLINVQSKFQGNSLLVAKGVADTDKRVIDGSQNNAVALDETPQSDLKYITPDSHLGELLDVLKTKIVAMCRVAGIPESFVTFDESRAESGYAIKLRNAPLYSYYKEQEPIYIRLINDFFEKLNTFLVVNGKEKYTTTPQIRDLKDEIEYTLDEKLKRDDYLITHGLIDKIDIVMSYFGMSEDEAKVYIEKRNNRSDEYGSADSLTQRIKTIL